MGEISHLPCPNDQCGSSDAYSFNTDKNTGYCHSCAISTSLFNGKLYGKSSKKGKARVLQTEEEMEDIFDMGEEEQTPTKTSTSDNTKGSYRPLRGIKLHTLEKYDVQTYENVEWYERKTQEKGTSDEIRFVYPSGVKKLRRLDLPKEHKAHFSVSGGSVHELFGQNLFPAGCSKMVTIVEGEFDALAAYQMLSTGRYENPVVSLPSATPSGKLWKTSEKWLDSFDKIIVSVDSDGKAYGAVEELFDLFPNKVYIMNHGDHKDANDFLEAGDNQAYVTAWWNAKKFSPVGFTSSKEDWLNAIDEEDPYDYTETPIEGLNKVGRGLVKGGITIVKAPPGVGKCLSANTPVLMYDGTTKTAKEVVVGDKLMGDDGTPRNVLNLCRGQEEMFRITPTKGEPWECNKSHILSLYHNGRNEVVNISVADYLEESSYFKTRAMQYRVGVGDFDFSPELPLPAYSFGLFLADGGSTGNSVLTLGKKKEAAKQKFISEVEALGYNTKTVWNEGKNCWSVRVSHGFQHGKNLFRHFDRSWVEDYKRSSKEDRRAFLAGVLDGDGHQVVSGVGYDFIAKQEFVADAVVFVARSLGKAAYKSIKHVKGYGNYYRVSLSGDFTDIPFERHKPKPREQIKDVLKTGFTIESLGEGDYYGFTVDGNHLFLLGDFTVTHNSSLLRMFMHDLVVKQGKPVAALMMEEMKSTTGRAMATYQLGANVNTREDAENSGFTEEQVKDALAEVVKDEKFISFDINPQDPIEDCLRQCKHAVTIYGVEYIFIDHLQRLAYLAGTESATGALTELGVKLTEFAKRRGIGIICISHVNSDGRTKYASAIEEEAIVVMELARDKQAEDEDERNTTAIVYSKNRPYAKTGPAGFVMYDEETTMVAEKQSVWDGVPVMDRNDDPFDVF